MCISELFGTIVERRSFALKPMADVCFNSAHGTLCGVLHVQTTMKLLIQYFGDASTLNDNVKSMIKEPWH